MQDDKSTHIWQEIAEEICREEDPQHLLELAHESEVALDECIREAGAQTRKRPARDNEQ